MFRRRRKCEQAVSGESPPPPPGGPGKPARAPPAVGGDPPLRPRPLLPGPCVRPLTLPAPQSAGASSAQHMPTPARWRRAAGQDHADFKDNQHVPEPNFFSPKPGPTLISPILCGTTGRGGCGARGLQVCSGFGACLAAAGWPGPAPSPRLALCHWPSALQSPAGAGDPDHTPGQ